MNCIKHGLSPGIDYNAFHRLNRLREEKSILEVIIESRSIDCIQTDVFTIVQAEAKRTVSNIEDLVASLTSAVNELDAQISLDETNLLLQGQHQYLVARLCSSEALKRSIKKNLYHIVNASVEDIEVSNDVFASEEDVDPSNYTQEEGDVLVSAALESTESANDNDVHD